MIEDPDVAVLVEAIHVAAEHGSHQRPTLPTATSPAIVARTGPVGASGVARHEVAVLGRGLDIDLTDWGGESERVVVIRVDGCRPAVVEPVRWNRRVPTETLEA